MNSNEILNKYINLIDKGYCSDCNELNCIDNFTHEKIAHAIRELQQENQELIEKIKTYEDPEDLTLMFMYCDEKAKDKIRELKKQLEDKEERLERLRISAIGHAKRELDLEKQQKEFIKWLEDYLNLFDYRNIEEQAGYDMLEEILQKYRSIIGCDKVE